MPDAGSPLDVLITGCILCAAGSGFLYFGWRAANAEDESDTTEIVRESTNPLSLFTVGVVVGLIGVILVIASQSK